MIVLGNVLGLGAEWWGLIFAVIGTAATIMQAIRKRRRKGDSLQQVTAKAAEQKGQLIATGTTGSVQQINIAVGIPDPSSHSMAGMAQAGTVAHGGYRPAVELITYLRTINALLMKSNYKGAKDVVAHALEEYDSRHE